MEVMSGCVRSPVPVIRSGNASITQLKSRSLQTSNLIHRSMCDLPLMRWKGRCSYNRQSVLPILQLQVCAKTSSAQGDGIDSSSDITSAKELVDQDCTKEGIQRSHAETTGIHVVIGASIAFAFALAVSDVGSAIARSGEIDLPPIEPEIATISSSKEINLAKQLKAVGAKMYGAFWCSHCFEQKLMFGKEAMKYIEYVECYPDGYRRGVKLAQACAAANIQGFPTWIINGQQYSGEQEFGKLAELSGLNIAQVAK